MDLKDVKAIYKFIKETDIIAKYVERLLAGARGQGGAGGTEDLLSEHGFLDKH